MREMDAMKLSRAALIMLPALALVGGHATGQELPPERADAVAMIKSSIDKASPSGDFHRIQGHVDLLDASKSVRFKLEIAPEVEYAIIGACDDNCGHIDLAVYDENDKLIGADRTGDLPKVLVPGKTGHTLIVRIDMVDCDESPCAYGVGVYEKQPRDPKAGRRTYEAAKSLLQ